ncbi:MAG: type II toxin-antitoxin system prevent-host-death family antitoxin [Alphaproteobacteria bacterium]
MQRATISELKNRLSAYLRRVKAGETVVVFDRDRPVARLEPIGGPREVDERLARLEMSGLVNRPTRPLPLALLAEAPPRAARSVLAALIEERAEDR